MNKLEKAVALLKEAHEQVAHFSAGRDTDLCYLPQKVYNAWFDLDFMLKKLRSRKP